MRGEFLCLKANFMIVVIICSIFTVYLSTPATAQETAEQETAETVGCCSQAKDTGESCVMTTEPQCDGTFSPTSCEQTSYCKAGCCVSLDGVCSTQVAKGTCQALEGYNWFDNAQCELAQCQKGCCVLGGAQCFYSTENKCKQTTSEYEALELDFRTAIGTEYDCLNICKEQDEGCCVTEEGKCSFTARGSCPSRGFDPSSGIGFFKDTFCSNDNLECKCESHAKQACIEGKEDVYWFDSCGNREEIVAETIEGSQNPEQNGDCDYATGTICGYNDGKAICKDLNCASGDLFFDETQTYDFQGQDRSNGESWCIYDAKPGVATDPVGSRHFRHMCINGEEVVAPCADARQEICVNGLMTDFPEEGQDIIEAQCVPNNWEECVTKCNTAGGLTDASEDMLADAMRKDRVCCKQEVGKCVWIDWGGPIENLGKCYPLVAPGGKFWSGKTNSVQGEPQCEIATQEGKTIWGESVEFAEDFECQQNCEIYTNDYLTLYNDYCTSLGDCGAQYNFQGKWTNEGIYRIWDKESENKVYIPKEEGGEKQEYAASHTLSAPQTPWGDLLVIGEGLLAYKIPGEVIRDLLREELGQDWEYTKTHPGVAGGATGLAAVSAYLMAGNFGAAAGSASSLGVVGSAGPWVVLAGILVSAFLVVYGTFFDGFLGMDRRTTVIVGGYVAAGAFVLAATIAIAACQTLCATGYGAIVAAVIAIAAFTLVALADTEDRRVSIECLPWQPPVKGYDCESCDADPMKPCSEYRCKAIGQNCAFISENEGTSRKTCYNANPDDVNSPKVIDRSAKVISHREDISSNFQLIPTETSTQVTGFKITPNVPPYSRVVLEVETNELSQCKIGTEIPQGAAPYEVLPNYMPDSYYDVNHNYTIAGVIPEKEYHYYIACEDPSGNSAATVYGVSFTVDQGSDLTPPQVTGASLKDGAFVAAGFNETMLVLYVDEQSRLDCKWSSEDKDFNFMENNMTCASVPMESYASRPAECGANVKLGEKQSRLYFRCKDHPIEYAGGVPTGNVLSSNVMQQSFKMSLQKTDSLIIQQTAPSGKLYTNNVTMQVLTQVGAESGKSVCYYNDIMFAKTNASYHEQVLSNLPTNDYKYSIECIDVAGNSATGNVTFSIDVDTLAPSVTAIHKSGSDLSITTNELSTCEYSNSSFIYGYGTNMPPDNSLVHSTTATTPNYYVICADSFNNRMPEVKIVLFESIS